MKRSLGKLRVQKLFDWRHRMRDTLQQTVEDFLDPGNCIASRWIQTAKGLMLLEMTPGEPASGAIYVFDRQREVWYRLIFDGTEELVTSKQFDQLFCEYKLFSYVAQPGLLLSRLDPTTA